MTSPYDYLSVDNYLKTQLDARTIAFALSTGLIDLLQRKSCTLNEVPARTGFGKRLILDLLAQNGVILCRDGAVSLSRDFRDALVYRDLLESKIDFADSVSSDIAEHFADLIDELPAFMAKSRTFALFRYDRCFAATAENLAATKRWMRFTTTLTRYEGRVLASLLDLCGVERLLDIGGNSGELAVQLCLYNPELKVLVADLPVVCQIGAAHIAQNTAASRIEFRPCDMRRDALPRPNEVVVFKSVLHDWPADDARMLLRRAIQACAPGGRLVIFERGPMRLDRPLPYAQLSNLVFAPFYREAGFYLDVLRELGCGDIDHRTVPLEMDFHLIVARRPLTDGIGASYAEKNDAPRR